MTEQNNTPWSGRAAPVLSRRRLLRSAALGGVFMLPLTAGLAGLARPARAADKIVFQLGWIKSIQHGGHFATIEQGYFAEEDIEAEFLAGGPASNMEVAVASGRAMMSDTDVAGIIFARNKDIPVKAFAAIMQRSPEAIMSLAEQPLKSLEDMVGKTVAIPQSRRPQVLALMERKNIPPSDIRFVPVGTDPGILVAKQVDGYFGWASNQGVMLKTRGIDIHIAYLDDLGAPGYAGVMFAKDETIETKADLIVRFLRAEIKGWQWHLDHPEEMARLMVDKYGQKGLDLEAQTAESHIMHEFVPVGDAETKGLLWISEDKYAAGIEFMKRAGILDKDSKITAAECVTQELIKRAHGMA